MPKEVNVTVDPRPLDSQGNPQDVNQNPPAYSTIGFANNSQPAAYPPPTSGYPPQQGYPHQPPQPGYPPQQNMGWNQGPQVTQPGVIITSPVVVQPTRVVMAGAQPYVTICPNCRQQITTRTDSETSMVQHFWAMGLCIIGCWPCCLIPYCIKDCQNTTHYCSNCGQMIGRHGTC
uniref:CSON009817 protein n=1 Tax=Culicoides sonorensis TaxID=179676 RepID=A0A336LHB8_CULSO